MPITKEPANAAATDAANENMAKNNRTEWNLEDYNVAVYVYTGLIEPDKQ